ncbi:BREX-1 system phosphatase PglZ type A [Terrilactibacillus laevilacticus]|uniref:BREX-1 system phosphatase PglZ type A n=1 Tax=Terrilactibacillus laevilacticus TaxID=1380157 RepID=UPI001147971C|nr:BREX-1 system phosphatase PglZ type A [Terrilactibacillus laevilacticus]
MKKVNEIQRELNQLFQKPLKEGTKRHLIFWYDENQEFVEDIHDLRLDNVRIWELTTNNLFYTKYELEKGDQTSHFLIYSTMQKPSPREDWLYDQYALGIEFTTDKMTMIMRELGITDNTLRPIFKKYHTFFRNKKRYAEFCTYYTNQYSEETIDITVLSVLCKVSINTMDEVIKALMKAENKDSNQLWESVKKFGDVNRFWRCVENVYGYTSENKSLFDLFIYFMLTYLKAKAPSLSIPQKWSMYIADYPMNAVVLMNQVMNNMHDRECYERLSQRVSNELHIDHYIDNWEIQDYVKIDVFQTFDNVIIDYLIEQLSSGIALDSYSQLIAERRLLHWYPEYQFVYEAIDQALYLIQLRDHYLSEIPEQSASELFQAYQEKYYVFDLTYRKFYVAYDKWKKDDRLLPLRELVENIYCYEYLHELSIKWSTHLSELDTWPLKNVPQQTDFYKKYVLPFIKKDERVFVIISDALRYEIGKSLIDKLYLDQSNKERKATIKISGIQSTLPSYTALGMASLLPHQTLTYQIEEDSSAALIVNGLRSSSIQDRDRILQQNSSNGTAVRYQDIMNMSRSDLRESFTGSNSKSVVYIYHNGIDATGDHALTESEVFNATIETEKTISLLVQKLVNDLHAVNVIITADHGFLYQRSKVDDVLKLPVIQKKNMISNRRFMISNEPYCIEGTLTFSMDDMIENDPSLFVTVPNGIERFKTQGSGVNYVHGGAMPQEVIVPVITYKSDRRKSSENVVSEVTIKLTSPTRKITNLVTYFEFFQVEPVSEKKLPTTCYIYFSDETGEHISNENQIIADRISTKPKERIYREQFIFRNQRYSRYDTYYLIIEDRRKSNNQIIEKIPFTIDISLANKD